MVKGTAREVYLICCPECGWSETYRIGEYPNIPYDFLFEHGDDPDIDLSEVLKKIKCSKPNKLLDKLHRERMPKECPECSKNNKKVKTEIVPVRE